MHPGTLSDLSGVYRVCLLTGRSGRDASALHDDPDLLGHVWAGAYLVFPDAVSRVLHDDRGVAGYCVGVPDTAALDDWLEEVWLPPLRERYPDRQRQHTRRRRARRAAAPPHPLGCRAAGDAPGAPPRRPPSPPPGPGLGAPRVVAAVLDALGEAGAPGVHLGVDEENTGAHAFYDRLGFTELRRAPGARIVGMPLPTVGR